MADPVAMRVGHVIETKELENYTVFFLYLGLRLRKFEIKFIYFIF